MKIEDIYYKVLYFCGNCRRDVWVSFKKGDDAPHIVKCPICKVDGARKLVKSE